MNATLEQILVTLGLLFAAMYLIILYLWISNLDEREAVIVRIRKNCDHNDRTE